MSGAAAVAGALFSLVLWALFVAIWYAVCWKPAATEQSQDVERRVTAGCSQPAVNKPQRVAGGRAMGSAGASGCTGRLARQVRYGGLKGDLRRVGDQPAVVKS